MRKFSVNVFSSSVLKSVLVEMEVGFKYSVLWKYSDTVFLRSILFYRSLKYLLSNEIFEEIAKKKEGEQQQ